MADPKCPKCGGSGWIIVEREEFSGAERCDCADAGRSARLEELAQIPPLYAEASLENFVLPADNRIAFDQLSRVVNDVRMYIREYPGPDRPGLLFLGEPGTGKTHLAVAALRAILKKGFPGIFFDYQNLLDRIRSSYDAASGASDKEAYRAALESPVLLLDDLGAHRVSDWVEDIVTSIVTFRCNHRKTLIATTNLPDPDAGDRVVERSTTLPGRVDYRTTLAERIGPRARSRLFEMCRIIRMPQMRDYRIRKRSGA
jgi:DNA replication protein DnaC